VTAAGGSLVGQPVRRREDTRFVTGRGCFTDDLAPAGLLHGLVVRSPWAAGHGLRLDVAAARACPQVHLVLTAAELRAAGLDVVPVDLPPPGHSFETWQATPQPLLASDRVRYAGDPIAFIVADNLDAARDAAEALAPQLTEDAAVTDLAAAAIDFSYAEGDARAVDAALGAAAQVVTAQIVVPRVDAVPLEPRGCLAHCQDGRFTLQVSTQRVQIIQRALADRVFRVPRDRMRVVAPDTGGGFGQKNGLYPEYVLCLEAARQLGRPVKWTPERGETLAAGCHARDNLFDLSAALDGRGHITAVRAVRRMNLGAYASSRAMVPVQNGLTHLTGVYGIAAADVRVEGVLTNTAPTCSYRGAGRPENVFACERLIDIVARRTNQDPVALRRAMLVPRKAMPWSSPLGTPFTTQDFAGLLESALAAVDHAGLPRRRRAAIRDKRLRGFGICLFAEDLHGSHEAIPARLAWSGERLDLIVGTGSAGHGHETTFLQVAADRLGLPMEAFGFRQSDTAAMTEGVGTAASWSMTLGGPSVRLAADAAIVAGSEIAADLLEAAPTDIDFADGRFRIAGTDRTVGWTEIFAARPGFEAAGRYDGDGQAVPAACHACEVEIDPDTGACTLVAYAIAQDCGTVINPMVVEGQLHGGMAQGIGEAWMEQIVYDAGSGQLLSGSLTDYALPRATDLPRPRIELRPTPATDNPLGVKGVGEAAATGAPAAFANAVLDALAPLGIIDLPPPYTAEALWRAIRAARG
jgi:carbon-monoxide dehydrogenase large subunit